MNEAEKMLKEINDLKKQGTPHDLTKLAKKIIPITEKTVKDKE